MSDPLPRSRRDLPLTRLLPNMLTLFSLCSGLTGIRYALVGKWHDAALAIVIAAVFDVLDGRVARMLNIASKFGAELDSLSDTVSFGVAPGLIIYMWLLKDSGGLGWFAVLVYAVCTAMRLARFNTMLEDHTLPSWTKSYFTGVSAPGGAGLALLPLFLFLEFGDAVHVPPTLIALWLILSGGLMVSRVPSFALKGWKVSPKWVAPLFLACGLIIAALITDLWLTLSCISIVYFFSLPVAWYTYRRRQQKDSLIS
jgi:CDP-diacylglycerol---serine O-phosphatidyltransferase